jgi:hypothetical protein
MSCRFTYAYTPLPNPKTSTMSPDPIAISGVSPRPRINNGEKKVAPPTPDAIAMVATRMPMGSMYQNSKLIGRAGG